MYTLPIMIVGYKFIEYLMRKDFERELFKRKWKIF